MQERSRTVNDLVNTLKSLRRDHYEYLEVKQLAEILARHRAKARLALKEYRDLKRASLSETDPIEKLYLGYEGMFLRDHLRDALRLYVMVNHDYHDAYTSYMNELKKDDTLTPPMSAIFALEPKSVTLTPANQVTKMSHPRLKRARSA